jgi:hypothetical protein
MSGDLFVFDEPSEEAILRATGTGGPYLEIALALRKHPNQWVRLTREFKSVDSARNTASNIRRGSVKGFAKGHYEALADTVDDKPVLFVRYTPQAEAPSAQQPAPEQPEQPERPDLDDDDDDLGKVRVDDNDVRPAVTNGIAKQVRAWARGRGMDVPERGRLPRQLVLDYFAAQGEEPPQHLRAVK